MPTYATETIAYNALLLYVLCVFVSQSIAHTAQAALILSMVQALHRRKKTDAMSVFLAGRWAISLVLIALHASPERAARQNH